MSRAWLVVLIAVSSVNARGDASLPGEPALGEAQCGSLRRAKLKRAVAEFCERDPSAEARGCHEVRGALRDCDAQTSFILRDGEVDVSSGARMRVEVRDRRNQSYAWFVDFTRDARRVVSFAYRYDDCDGG